MKIFMPPEFPACRSLGGGRWRLLEPWTFFVDGFPATAIPGFVCDLYSSPWVFTMAIPSDELDNRPALMHDWLYATVGLRKTQFKPSVFSRGQADEVLREAMQMCGFSWARRNVIHLGVRIGGGSPWGEYTRKGYSVANPCMER